MANLAAAPLVNASVYRHFAAVTFAITVCVALFADGEARQTVSDGIAREQQAAKLREADTRKFGPRKIGDRRESEAAQGGFGEDFDPSYGAGSGTGASSPGSFNPHFASEGELASSEPVGPPPAILSPDAVAALTPEEQRAYLERLRHRKKAPARKAEVRDLAAIEESSRARSGSSADD